MSDFMIWLYLHYIKPYLDTVPADDYNFHMDMIHNELGYHALESYEKNLEFTAIHAFLLGLRTAGGKGGDGLRRQLMAERPEGGGARCQHQQRRPVPPDMKGMFFHGRPPARVR